GRGAVHVLDVGGGLLLPMPQAMEVVLDVGKVLFGASVLFGVAVGPGHYPAATIERKRAFGADELHPMATPAEATMHPPGSDRIDVLERGVFIANVERVRRVAVVLHFVLTAGGKDRNRGIDLHRPENDVIQMHTPIVAKAIAVILEPAEIAVET